MVKYSTEYDIRGEFMYQNINESTKTIRDTWEFENTSIDVIKFEDEKERFPVLINNIKKYILLVLVVCTIGVTRSMLNLIH